jgi:hypothetical protein
MLRRTIATLLAALTATLAGTAPVLAAGPVSWTMAPCATAYLGRAVRDVSVGWFVISGSAYQCAPAVAGAGIRLAVYGAGSATGYSMGYQVRLFETLELSPEFGVALVQLPGEYGACVLAGEYSRVTCVRVVVAEDRRTATTERIEVDDPLVAKEVGYLAPYTGSVYPPSSKDGNPTCGTCY